MSFFWCGYILTMCFYRKVFLFVGFLKRFFCVLILFWQCAFIFGWSSVVLKMFFVSLFVVMP